MSPARQFAVILVSACMGAVIALAGFVGYLKLVPIPTGQQALPGDLASTDPSTAQPMHASVPAAGALPGISIGASGSTPALMPGVDNEESIITAVYKKAAPWVVNIDTTTRAMTMFGEYEGRGSGSGVIINKAGYILTNNHVIQDATTMTVTIHYGGTVKELNATLQGTDPTTDLAVLKLESPPADLPVAELGDSDTLREGQRAIVIGNPYGLDSSITVGVISALQRSVTVAKNTTYEGMIQTDAAVNPGNSGGPLLNSRSQVVGINTVIFSQSGGSQGLGFAIPINFAKKVVADLVAYGKVRRPYLGVQGMIPLGPKLARYLGIGVNSGVLVQQVIPGGPADLAGIRGGTETVMLERDFYIVTGGDVLLSINGQRVTTGEDVVSLVRKLDADQTIDVELFRNGTTITKKVKLAVLM